MHAASDRFSFEYNLCGQVGAGRVAQLTREEPTCLCGTSVRIGGVVHVLSLRLFSESIQISDFPDWPRITGIDMSGAPAYGGRLRRRLGDTNTFLPESPYLGIRNSPSIWLGSCDVVTFFEHVVPLVWVAFRNTSRLLKPGGVPALTGPYAKECITTGRFPELSSFRIETRKGRRILTDTKPDGIVREYDQLVSHGGGGQTLKMRVFSESGLLDEFRGAGFVDIKVHDETRERFGILVCDSWLLPISARRAVGAR
jgi:hypothetical protein